MIIFHQVRIFICLIWLLPVRDSNPYSEPFWDLLDYYVAVQKNFSFKFSIFLDIRHNFEWHHAVCIPNDIPSCIYGLFEYAVVL